MDCLNDLMQTKNSAWTRFSIFENDLFPRQSPENSSGCHNSLHKTQDPNLSKSSMTWQKWQNIPTNNKFVVWTFLHLFAAITETTIFFTEYTYITYIHKHTYISAYIHPIITYLYIHILRNALHIMKYFKNTLK